jgi:hypothetical protein
MRLISNQALPVNQTAVISDREKPPSYLKKRIRVHQKIAARTLHNACGTG